MYHTLICEEAGQYFIKKKGVSMKKFFLGLSLVFAALVSFSAWGDAPKISILGDSYSTYQDWIPRGNWAWYPHRNTLINYCGKVLSETGLFSKNGIEPDDEGIIRMGKNR